MSVLELQRHAIDVRQRLRNPPNAVMDHGIDLKRKPVVRPKPVENVPKKETVSPLWFMGPVVPSQFVKPESSTRQLSQKPQLKPFPTVHEIQRAVCQEFNVKLVDMNSERRTWNIVMPRHIAMYLAKELTSKSLPAIGLCFGGRDHTTCMHAHRKIAARRTSDAELDRVIKKLIAAIDPEAASA